MKKLVISLSLVSTILFSSCIGSFTAFNKVLKWNKQATSEKFVNELLFIALLIVPVYSFAMLGDLIIFNSIEFWTGENPIAMKEGEIKTKTVKKDGKILQITTTKNKVNILVLKGENAGNSIDLLYNTQDNSWNCISKEGKVIKLTDYKEGMQHVYLPNNKVITLDANASKIDKIAAIDKQSRNQTFSKSYTLAK